jgi:hypothetical protein
VNTLPEARLLDGTRRGPLDTWTDRLRYPLSVYAVSRLVLLLVVLGNVVFQHASLGRSLANWDGQWYLKIFSVGYPPSPWHYWDVQTTLGFLPLYSMLIWLVANIFLCGPTVAGVLIALVCGGIATVQVDLLAREWWGDNDRTARRVVTFFCFFPGSVVFSMVYTEGLLLTLICGCLLALRHRRWLLAGVLAAFSTAVGPVAEAIIPTCIVASGLELYRYGWRDREARRSLLAPLLSPVGLISFGIFLWAWTGTPLASYKTQRYAWSESTTPLAVWRIGRSLYYQVRDAISGRIGPSIDLNLIAGLLGTVFLIYCLVLLWRDRERIGWPPLIWTVFLAVLTLTSQKTPPNARLLICAFPAVMIFAAKIRTRRVWYVTMAITLTLLIVMSYLTYSGAPFGPLRP